MPQSKSTPTPRKGRLRVGVTLFPGSNCDHDALVLGRYLDAVETIPLWHEKKIDTELDAIIIPGGFTYGDYLRCGAIAAASPVMQSVAELAAKRLPIIGICNGFQILCEAKILPGALLKNESGFFSCKKVDLQITSHKTPFTKHFKAQEVLSEIPIAHGQGRYYIDADGLAELKANQQIVFRYAQNPNGSVDDIAGICNVAGNVVGLMPHPERALDPLVGKTDGLKVFQSLLQDLGA